MELLVKSHKILAEHVAGKHIMLMNSLGKDSLATLLWLTQYAKPSKVTSVFFRRLAHHPDDDRYQRYLIGKFPNVVFLEEPNAHELNDFGGGRLQDPIGQLRDRNSWEHYDFSMQQHADCIAAKVGAEYVASGLSRYESVARATVFHQKGILDEKKKRIYPLGMMGKQTIMDILRAGSVRLHPCYKVSPTTFDHPSYYKMRSAFIVDPGYYARMTKWYPMMVLDKYRWEKLLGNS